LSIPDGPGFGTKKCIKINGLFKPAPNLSGLEQGEARIYISIG
jgi:hypothetical protein